MTDKIVCDRCGQTYTDKESIDMTLAQREEWARLCRDDGVEPRGLIACPIFACPGELVLKKDYSAETSGEVEV